MKPTVVAKNIGYELRCADPIPYDMEYARDLGYCASKFVIEGGNGAMVSLQNGVFVPIPFGAIMDMKTGRIRVRMVDIASDRYMIARRYMLRLRRDDFEDEAEVAKFAKVLGVTRDRFREEFEYLVREDPRPRLFHEDGLYAHSVRPPAVG